jgi:hypothetical protein
MEQWQGQETLLRRLGKAFHLYGDDIAHEPLPRRWVDLIRYLDEQERKSLERRQPAGDGEASLAKGEVAVRSQEKVLRELMRTDEAHRGNHDATKGFAAENSASACGAPLSSTRCDEMTWNGIRQQSRR